MSHDSKFWALTHGTSGLLLDSATVWVPMVIVLIRARAPLLEMLRSPIFAVALALVTAFIMTVASPLLHRLGVTSEGLLEWILSAAVAAGLGYVGGLAAADVAKADSSGSY